MRIRHLEHQLETERAYARQLETERRVLRQALLADIPQGEDLQHRITALSREKERLDAVCPDTAVLKQIIERLQAEQGHPPGAAHEKQSEEPARLASPALAVDAMCLHVVREMAQEIGRLQRLLSQGPGAEQTARMLEEHQALREENVRLSRKLTTALDRLAQLEKMNFQIRAQAEMDDERVFNIRRSLDASSSGSSPTPLRHGLGSSPSVTHMPQPTSHHRNDSAGHAAVRAVDTSIGHASPAHHLPPGSPRFG